ncbi:MAG TPA: response regulator [Caulobacteraceae bacterium]|jgi:CheY-like chemotaxis protein
MLGSFERDEWRAGAGGADAEVEGARHHVLIVDDHAPSREVCAGYCDLFDHTCESVGGGAEAVAALRRGSFSVVVMNVHMQDGALEAVRAIRALPGPVRETPIIGLTAIGRGEEAQRWLAAGLAGVLPKPITAARLFTALSAALAAPDDAARSWAPAS